MEPELSAEERGVVEAWASELASAEDRARASLLRRLLLLAGRQRWAAQAGSSASSMHSLEPVPSGSEMNFASLAQVSREPTSSELGAKAVLQQALGSQSTFGHAKTAKAMGTPSISRQTTETAASGKAIGSTATSQTDAATYLGETALLPPRVVFVADPMDIRIERASIFESRLGIYLKKKRLMFVMILLTCLFATVVTIVEPFATDVPEDGPLLRHLPGERILELRARRAGLFTWLAKMTSCLLLWTLLLHHVNKELFFMVLRTFDAIMIMGSFVVSESAKFCNRFDYWAAQGHYDSTWIVFDILDTFLVVFPCGVLAATMDSWNISAWVMGERFCKVKIAISMMAVAYFLKSYLDTVFPPGNMQWSEKPFRFAMLSVNPREAYASAEVQKIIFLGKCMVKYAMGHPFAFLRPGFTRHDAHHGKAIVSTLYDGSWALGQRFSAFLCRRGAEKAVTPEASASALQQGAEASSCSQQGTA